MAGRAVGLRAGLRPLGSGVSDQGRCTEGLRTWGSRLRGDHPEIRHHFTLEFVFYK